MRPQTSVSVNSGVSVAHSFCKCFAPLGERWYFQTPLYSQNQPYHSTLRYCIWVCIAQISKKLTLTSSDNSSKFNKISKKFGILEI